MFRLLFVKNIKSIASLFRPKKLQGPSCRKLLYNVTSTPPTKQKTGENDKRKPKSTEEIFFPPVKLAGIQDKIALVTGGSEGIGLRCVKELLSCGIKGVMIADSNETNGARRVTEFSREYGPKKVAFIQINPCNYILLKSSSPACKLIVSVLKQSFVDAFVSTINHFKSLHIVINTIKFKDMHWEEQVDEYVKGIVLSTQLSLELMGRNNGGHGGILVNVVSCFHPKSDSSPLFVAVEDFIVRFDRGIATTYFEESDVKVLTICRATLDSVGCDLATVITKGSNGCVWVP